jgi:hypothetical protein
MNILISGGGIGGLTGVAQKVRSAQKHIILHKKSFQPGRFENPFCTKSLLPSLMPAFRV